MANTTIDQLASLTGTSVASNDLFLVYDASTVIEKSITAAELKNMIGNGSFTFTIAGTSDAIIVTSTDADAAAAPDIVFYRNSASPAASDAIGNIVFRGKSSTGVDRDYAGIFTTITSPTNAAETGAMAFNTINAGTLAERVRITAAGNMGIGTVSPATLFHIEAATPTLTTVSTTTTGTTLGNKGNRVLLRANSTTIGNGGEIVWAAADTTTGRWAAISGHIVGNASGSATGDIVIATKTSSSDTALTERMRINAAGNVIIGNGETSATPAAGILEATDGSGTNITGAALTIQGGRGTGTGLGGSLIFSTAAAGSSGATLNAASTRMTITANGDIGIGTTTPASRLQVAGQIAGAYTAHANGTTAMALGTNTVVKVTPTATATFTTTVAPAGSRASVIIVTSGVTSYTITFGTGFQTTGTLATGTTTARTFVIEFISDGTTMIEASRTVAMA
jgi:hypothetical protein